MKYLYLAFISLTLLACNSVKKAPNTIGADVIEVKETEKIEILRIAESKCPADGVCTFEVIKNSAIVIKKDEFGATYPQISNDGNKTVLKFEYSRNPIKGTQDGSYRELIYLEIDSKIETLSLENETLKQANASFGRLCFCRGQTGYYPIINGSLILTKKNKYTYNLKFDFKINEVPQVITSIEENFTLK